MSLLTGHVAPVYETETIQGRIRFQNCPMAAGCLSLVRHNASARQKSALRVDLRAA